MCQWCTGYWIDFFKTLKENGYYEDTDIVHRLHYSYINVNFIKSSDCLKFAFMNVIQAELDRMKNLWNMHRIRCNRGHINGIPDELYYLPEERGTELAIRPNP